jgi:hypothetical protein
MIALYSKLVPTFFIPRTEVLLMNHKNINDIGLEL